MTSNTEHLEWRPRAVIQFRYLEEAERARIARSLDKLATVDIGEPSPNLRKLQLSGPGSEFFEYRGSGPLRVIVSVKDGKYIVEDIVDRSNARKLP